MAQQNKKQGLKDFNDILTENPKHIPSNNHHNALTLQALEEMKVVEKSMFDQIKDKTIKAAAPILLTIFTGPFNTTSIMLQVAPKDSNESLKRKLEIWPKNDLIKAKVYGDNKIYKPFMFKGYQDCLQQLGREGLRGFYKGNLTGILLMLSNGKLRSFLYENLNKVYNFSEQWKANLLTIFTCTIADFVTLPLMFCQTRLTFQNSLSNFRTYNSIFDLIKQTSPQKYLAGSSVLLLKNIVLTLSWKSFFPNAPIQSFIFSTFLSHFLTYPFITIIRQLQTNDVGVPMMNQRKQNVRDCIKRIWGQLGIRGYYRGFFGYALVHTFLNFIMVDMNVRSGYFNEIRSA